MNTCFSRATEEHRATPLNCVTLWSLTSAGLPKTLQHDMAVLSKLYKNNIKLILKVTSEKRSKI